jgi:hypothetical protein
MSLLRSWGRLAPLVLSCLVLLNAPEARAACVDGDTQRCSENGCEGYQTCNGKIWGRCNEFTGRGLGSCSVCGRQGTYRSCTFEGEPIQSSCSAYGAEVCNGCDDDGDGLVDEDSSNSGPLTDGACSSGAGCHGTRTCVNGAFQCNYFPGARVPCANGDSRMCASDSTAACMADGSLGPCQPPTVEQELCNGCDDDHDGIVDNNPGQGTGSLTRECQGNAGVCPGSVQHCEQQWSGPYLIPAWGACTALAETCNGADDDCDGLIDEDNVCRTDTNTCSCQPVTCAQLGKNCGTLDDGCGWPLDCGTCPSGESCGGGGAPNVCSGCTPLTQAQACAGKNCGTVSDGCHGTYDCGSCTDPLSCGGGGMPNVCGCPGLDYDAACTGKCGVVSNGCGGRYTCGDCTSPNTCSGGGVSNVCGCTPVSQAMACAGKNCGTVSNGCFGTYTCGACTSPQTCGGGGTGNVCGCTPIAQAMACAGKNCGTVPNGCGGTYTCGTCSGLQTCGGGGRSNVCGCTPRSASEACGERECGTVSNGCGQNIQCGTCFQGESCVAGVCR